MAQTTNYAVGNTMEELLVDLNAKFSTLTSHSFQRIELLTSSIDILLDVRFKVVFTYTDGLTVATPFTFVGFGGQGMEQAVAAFNTYRTTYPPSELLTAPMAQVAYNDSHRTHVFTQQAYVVAIQNADTALINRLPSSAGGTGGGFVTVVGGGRETFSTIAAAGAATALNLSDGNFFDVFLDQPVCAISLTNATPGKVCYITIQFHQDVVGGRTVTWPVGTLWPGGLAPTLTVNPNGLDAVGLYTIDGGTTWIGNPGLNTLQ